MSPEEHLAVPYVLEVWSERQPDGEWIRNAEFPELPGCRAEAFSVVEAVEQAERQREDYILEHLALGKEIPVPRPPLRA